MQEEQSFNPKCRENNMNFLISMIIGTFLACSEEKESDTGVVDSFAPTEGSWSYDGSEYSNDGCNLVGNPLYNPTVLDALVFQLTNSSDSVLTFTSEAGAGFDCTRDGTTAVCVNSLETDVTTYNDAEGNPVVDDDGNPVDPDAVATLSFEADVIFEDAVSATYSAKIDGTCDGADCEPVLESLGIMDNPCRSDLSGRVLYQAD